MQFQYSPETAWNEAFTASFLELRHWLDEDQAIAAAEHAAEQAVDLYCEDKHEAARAGD